MDDDGHGTHVAGIIAAEWNGSGVCGVTCGAKIMAVKVNNDISMMSIHEAIQGYRYVIAAQEAGVDVVAINNSWNDDAYSKFLDMAVRVAGRLGAVSVFAAGNDRSDIDMIGQVTNAFINNPYVVVVGNSNKYGLASETSNYGKRSVDVFAPGEEIYSTMPTGTGPGDHAADPLVTNGVTFACDYESVDVRNNADGSVFGFEGGDATTLSIADEGHGSAHSLSLTGTAEEALTVTLDSKALAAGSECRGLCMWIKAPAAKTMSCTLICGFADGDTQTRQVNLTRAEDDWQSLAFPIDKSADKDSLTLSITFQVFEWQGSPDPTVLIDDVKLTSATIPYDYLGLFDPNTKTAEFHLYNDQCCERRGTLVNTGKGILLAGGSELRDGNNLEPDIDVVRTVDPKTFAVSTVALPEDVSMIGSWFASAYDEEGNGYLFCGTSLTGFYKLSFVDGSMACTVLAEGPIIGEEGEESGHGLSAGADGFVPIHQDGRMVAGPTKSGIIASGPVMTDETGVVTADTYTVAWGGTSFEPTDRQMSVTKMYDMAGTTYRGRFYVIGASESEVGGWVFASEPVETLAQPGDVPEPDNPSEPAYPRENVSA